MHILKISLNKIGETNKYFCAPSYSSSYKIGLLGDFLGDFGYKGSRERISEIINNPIANGISGNCSDLDKKANGNLEISFSYDSEEAPRLEISPSVLLKILDLYMTAREKIPTPQEIIIKLDENMENPIVETVGNLNPCAHDHDKKFE